MNGAPGPGRSDREAAAVHPCQSCNLCCDGTLFNEVWVSEDEGAVLQDRFQLVRAAGKLGFAQPCPHSKPTGCACYRERPLVCREFRCTALAAYDHGDIDQATLTARIAAARDALTKVLCLAEAGANLQQVRAAQTQPGGAETNPALHLALGVLELLLDRHFREPGTRAMQINPRSGSGQPTASPLG